MTQRRLGGGRGDDPGDLIDKLAGHGAVVSPLPHGRWELIITLPAAGLGTAATTALALAGSATNRPIISLQVTTTAEFDRRIQASEDEPEQQLTVAQAADRLGVSPQRIRKMIADQQLPATRAGQRTWLIPAGAVKR